MANETVKFGRVLEEGGSDRKIWFVVVPLVLALIALAGVGIYGISQSKTVQQDVQAARAKADELQKTVDERDSLLVKARADEGLLRAAGQATAIFYGIDPQAVESGVAVALPGDRAAKVILYGLQAPPEGQRYTLAARGPDGTLTPLRDVPVGGDGSAFLLARDIPERTAALELVLRDASLGPVGGEPEAGGKGQAGAGAPPGSPISLEGATPRVAARYPAEDERGVLTQAPAVQARRAAR